MAKSPMPASPGIARVETESTLPEAELQRHRKAGSAIRLEPGQTLFEQGSPADTMFAVLRGKLAVIMNGVQIAEISSGQVVGEMAFLLGEPRSATVRALSVCEVSAISPHKMRLLMQHPDVVFQLLKLFARRVEAANRALMVRTQTVTDLREQVSEQLRMRTVAEANLGEADALIAELRQQLADTSGTGSTREVLVGVFRPLQAGPTESAFEDIPEEELKLLTPPPILKPAPAENELDALFEEILRSTPDDKASKG